MPRTRYLAVAVTTGMLVNPAVGNTPLKAGRCLPFEEAHREAMAVADGRDPEMADLPDATTEETRAAEFEDIAQSARDRGWNLEDAYRQLCWQSDFVAIVNELERQHPESFAGAWITRTGPERVVDGAVVQFKDEAPQAVRPSLANVDVEIRENRGFSLVELERRQDRVHNRFIELGYTDLVSYYNLEDGSIDVEVVHLPSGPDRGVNASEMRSALPPDLLVDGLNITFRDSLPGQDESSVHGGGMLEPAGGSGLLCTGGFNVRKGSVRGVSTAWHCDPPFTYENRDGGHEYSATQRGSHIGEWGDLRWFSTAGSETDDFYWKWGHHRRDVSSVRHSVEGEELCRFGMKTGRKCGDHVYKKGVDKTVRGHSVNRLTAMHRENAEKGDSGGPWYWGTTAIGVHQGEKWIAPFTRDIFSEAGRLDEALGVTVLK